LVLKEITSSGSTDFFVWMKEKADLRPAHSLLTKKAKGQFVYRTLRDTANRTQNGVRAQLNRLGVDYRSFYIANKILVRDGDMTLVNLLAARPDVSRITANHLFQLQEPFVDSNPPAQVAGVESNISFIKAPDVWALGYKGAGIVLAGNDTGLDWDHPAIKNQYRGWNGSTVDHNYNWWDATGTYLSVPDDGHGHGTHTTGTMVGDDGNGNQIGVAPGAKTIHCKNMTDSGSGSDATFTECFEFDLAPWDLTGNNPDPDKAPDAVNNSWGYWGGDNPQFEGIISTLQAAGILVEVSAGNEGPSCQTLRSPGDYGQVLTTGSVNHAGGSLPGTITDFSSRGPSDLYPGDFLPDIMAPGESIRSSLPGGNNYASWSGTSMAGPHVTALVGLMWNASPALRGDVSTTVQAILGTAVPLDGQVLSCGGDYTDGPNNDWGYGTIDALAAVQEAIQLGPPFRVQATPVDQVVCAPNDAVYDVDVTKNDPNFTGTVELTVSGQPTGTSASFSPRSVELNNTDTASSILTISNIGTEDVGSFALDVIGTSTGEPVETNVQLQIFSSAPETVTLSQPANGAAGVDLKPFFAWSSAYQASSYLLEVATDIDFSNIVYWARVEDPSHTAELMLDSYTEYYWQITSANVCSGNASSSSSFTTRDVPPTLLVDDDDNAPNVLLYYTHTLDALEVAYDIWDTGNSDNEPDAATLSIYDNVIWFTGAEFGGYAGPGSSAEAALSSWLDKGGCLFISSQDYGWDKGMTSFMQNYLGVTDGIDDVGQVSVTGEGSVYGGLGPYQLEYPFTDEYPFPDYSDALWAAADAELAFSGNIYGAATDKVTATYFTTFLGYPFEAIPDPADRQAVLTAFFNTCGGELTPIHVGDLDGKKIDAARGRWDAVVTITVHDERHDQNGGITISGTWSNGATGSDECTTNIDGQCEIVKSNLKSNVSAVTFSIDGLLGSGCTYDSGSNHDLDGDSDGTTIIVLKDPPPPEPTPGDTPMHVGDLEGSSAPASNRNKWIATITVTVHNDESIPISEITVSGTWSGGTSGEGSCTTDSAGKCSIAKNNLRSNVNSVTFTVDSLTDNSSNYYYESGANDTGSSIAIPKP
jgi:subtilisin family serine protease